MRTRIVLTICTMLVAVSAMSEERAREKSTDAKSTPTQAQSTQPASSPTRPAATSAPAAAPAKPVVLGKSEPVKWTATTLESATNEAQKKVLESGKPIAVTGEVVDVSCYLQLGKRGEAHIPCGTKCITNGQPIGIVDDEGNLYIVMAEEHHPRRDGQADLRTVFLPLLAKQVTVNGITTDMKGYRPLFVNAADLAASAKPAGSGQ